jgi:hypothetical protein
MFETRKRILTLSQTKHGKDDEEILKTYELFVGGDVHYITKPFCSNVLKLLHPGVACESNFLYIFPIIISIFLLHMLYIQIHR